MNQHAVDLGRAYDVQALLRYAMIVNGIWRNACALGVYDDKLWGAIDFAWGSLVGGMDIAIAVVLLLAVVQLGVPWPLAILLGVLLGTAAVLGDLAESLIKRQTHVKDSGDIMPGHGGMLDRVDSLMFAVIVVYVFAQLIGKL